MSPASLRWTDPLTRRLVPFELDEQASALLVGRRDGVSVHIEDSRMSRNHAKLTRVDGAWTIEDVGSTLGTWLDRDGRALQEITTPIALRHGDRLRLGHTVIEYLHPEARDGSDAGQYRDAPLIRLTGRERQVLELMCDAVINGAGRLATNRELAAELQIEVSTVRTHVKHLMMKFDVSDRTLLVQRAIEGRWVHLRRSTDPPA